MPETSYAAGGILDRRRPVKMPEASELLAGERAQRHHRNHPEPEPDPGVGRSSPGSGTPRPVMLAPLQGAGLEF